MSNKDNKVIKFHTPFRMNIGLVIFLVIFVYLMIRLVIFLLTPNIAVYEVDESYIDNNITFSGIADREEHIVTSTGSGYITYFIRNGEKVGKQAIVYTLDSTGTTYEALAANNDNGLTEENYSELSNRISSFKSSYSSDNFSNVYSFKYEIQNAVLEMSDEYLIEQLTSKDNDDKLGSIESIISDESGIVTYYKDGFEDITFDSLKASDFNKTKYTRKNLKTSNKISDGSPVYKLTTNEEWHIYGNLSESDVLKLDPEFKHVKGDITAIQTNDNADMLDEMDEEDIENEITVLTLKMANCDYPVDCIYEIYKKGSNYFIDITLNKLMINFIDDRFIDCEIIIGNPYGLKVPNQSLATKTAFMVPTDYFTGGENGSSKDKLLIKNSSSTDEIEQISPKILGMKDDFYYVDFSNIDQSSVIVKVNSNDVVSLNELTKEEIPGVYTCNDGIATFRYIKIESQSEEYTICGKNIPYSLSLYDQIVLDSTVVKKEGEILFK